MGSRDKIPGYNTIIASNAEIGSSSTLICGCAGSTAEQYAKESNHIFMNLDPDFIVPTNGELGNGLVWKLNNDVLTISGIGAMPNFKWSGMSVSTVEYTGEVPPWWVHRKNVKKIIIEEGITNIGEASFTHFDNLEERSISNTVTTIEDEILSYSTIKEIVLPESVNRIEQTAFSSTLKSLEKITILNKECVMCLSTPKCTTR